MVRMLGLPRWGAERRPLLPLSRPPCVVRSLWHDAGAVLTRQARCSCGAIRATCHSCIDIGCRSGRHGNDLSPQPWCLNADSRCRHCGIDKVQLFMLLRWMLRMVMLLLLLSMLLFQLPRLRKGNKICDATLHCAPCNGLGLRCFLARKGSQAASYRKLTSLPDMPSGPAPWFVIHATCYICIACIPAPCLFVSLLMLWSASLIAFGIQ
mmetsp:Transcript_42617/g.84353  ORF Transcript_42617/g.84353 Transcript_42617/m.84353 type:complete len:209 (-) Transcript_42617:572-1198(-)